MTFGGPSLGELRLVLTRSGPQRQGATGDLSKTKGPREKRLYLVQETSSWSVKYNPRRAFRREIANEQTCEKIVKTVELHASADLVPKPAAECRQ